MGINLSAILGGPSRALARRADVQLTERLKQEAEARNLESQRTLRDEAATLRILQAIATGGGELDPVALAGLSPELSAGIADLSKVGQENVAFSREQAAAEARRADERLTLDTRRTVATEAGVDLRQQGQELTQEFRQQSLDMQRRGLSLQEREAEIREKSRGLPNWVTAGIVHDGPSGTPYLVTYDKTGNKQQLKPLVDPGSGQPLTVIDRFGGQRPTDRRAFVNEVNKRMQARILDEQTKYFGQHLGEDGMLDNWVRHKEQNVAQWYIQESDRYEKDLMGAPNLSSPNYGRESLVTPPSGQRSQAEIGEEAMMRFTAGGVGYEIVPPE